MINHIPSIDSTLYIYTYILMLPGVPALDGQDPGLARLPMI